MNKKYRMEKEEGFYRIYALKDFGEVTAGQRGGLIEKEDNLSTTGDCWVYANAKVSDNGRVIEGGRVAGNGEVCNNGKVTGNAIVTENATIEQNATISGHSRAGGKAIVSGNATISGEGRAEGYAIVNGNAIVSEEAAVIGHGLVTGTATLKGDCNGVVYGRIFEGVWEHSPLYIQGSFHHLINSKPGHITIGYITKTFAEWESKFEAWAKVLELSEAQIPEYKLYIDMFKKLGK